MSQEKKERKLPKVLQGRHVSNKKLIYSIYFFLRLSVIVMLVLQFFNRNYENMLLCVLTLVLFMLPSALERRLNIDLPDTLEIIILLFIYAAEILGEIQSFYITFPYWDTMLHTMNGFLCAAIGFALVDLLNRHERISLSLSPFYMAIVAFCFSMTVGVVWEFFEFFMDHVFLLDMQKDTILNTISTVNLDPNHGTQAVIIQGIQDVILVLEDGTHRALGLGGYLDVGIVDTMQDLFVNFIRLLLREEPGKEQSRPPVHPPGAGTGSARRPGKRFPGGIKPGMAGILPVYSDHKEVWHHAQPDQSQHPLLRGQLHLPQGSPLHPERDPGGLHPEQCGQLQGDPVRVLPAGRPRHPVQRLQVTRSIGKGKALSPPGQGLILIRTPRAAGWGCRRHGMRTQWRLCAENIPHPAGSGHLKSP